MGGGGEALNRHILIMAKIKMTIVKAVIVSSK
jgi:hypothetical protein